jgi:hypothetical protein
MKPVLFPQLPQARLGEQQDAAHVLVLQPFWPMPKSVLRMSDVPGAAVHEFVSKGGLGERPIH